MGETQEKSSTRTEFRQQATLNLLTNPGIITMMNGAFNVDLASYTGLEKPNLENRSEVYKLQQTATAFYISGLIDEVIKQVDFH